MNWANNRLSKIKTTDLESVTSRSYEINTGVNPGIFHGGTINSSLSVEVVLKLQGKIEIGWEPRGGWAVNFMVT